MHLVWSALTIAAVFCFGRPFALLISGSSNESLLDLASRYMYLTNLFYPFVGAVLLYRQVLQSLGNQCIPILCSGIEVAIKAAIVAFFARFGGFLLICLTEPATWVVNTAIPLGIYYARYHRGLARAPE